MACWYNCGSGLVKMDKSFARADAGVDGYLCCPGPSLADINDEDLHVPGVMIFGLNTAYPKIRPDVWLGLDKPDCYDVRLWWEPFIKLCRQGYHKETHSCGKKIAYAPNTYFIDLENSKTAIEDSFQRRAHDTKFVWIQNSLAAMLHVMIWMGIKNIYLVGCDFGGNKDYYDDRQLTKERHEYNRRLYSQQIEYVRTFTKVAAQHGVKLYSCTPNSPINEFLPFKNIKDAISYSQTLLPQQLNPIHACDVDLCEWKSEIKDERGIMVGVAPMHEDLLPWWINNYKKYNNYPIVFADFGISDKYKSMCEPHGKIIDMTKININGWFRKPFAVLESPFRKTIWTDSDIEIRGDLGELFSYSDDDKIGVGWDSYNPAAFRKNMESDVTKLWDTGLMSFEHGSNIIRQWAVKTINARRDQYMGDHEIFSIVLWENKMPIKEIPKTLHRMRLDPASDGISEDKLLSMHWTGPWGKNHIREMMKNG